METAILTKAITQNVTPHVFRSCRHKRTLIPSGATVRVKQISTGWVEIQHYKPRGRKAYLTQEQFAEYTVA